MINKDNFYTIISNLSEALCNNYSCIEAQHTMSPNNRYKGHENNSIETSKPSAVLILIYPNKETIYTVFIKRPTYNGPHSNQISLPGGKQELTDENLEETALRETNEEVGVPISDITVIGKISPLYIPHSNYLVTPFIGYCQSAPLFIPDKKEVKSIIQVSINHLFDEANRDEFVLTRNGFEDIIAPYYDLEGEKLWGATAMIMSEFMTLFKDSTRL